MWCLSGTACLHAELRGHSSWQDHWRRSRPGVIVYLFNWQNYQRPSPHAQAWRHCNTYQPQSRHSQGNEFFSPSLSWPWRLVEIWKFARMPKVLCVVLGPTYISKIGNVRRSSITNFNWQNNQRDVRSITNMIRMRDSLSMLLLDILN